MMRGKLAFPACVSKLQSLPALGAGGDSWGSWMCRVSEWVCWNSPSGDSDVLGSSRSDLVTLLPEVSEAAAG